EGRLFKRDIAGEFLDTHPDFKLVDSGFVYYRDPTMHPDDMTWFLMEKKVS
ncbi:MAG: pseudaminic acid biosynthesis-associated methylase, partial [Alphaproteobacteria bacterium]|nr:pseudaminic acid biosynthesis-associated methylase [Alphaproteobacteria bacterium]